VWCADLVHPDVIPVPVAAPRVIAQQQVRVHLGQQGGEFSRRFVDVRPHEPGPVRRVIEQDRPVPAVRVAQVHGPVGAEDRGARPQLLQPPARDRPRPHLTVGGHHDDHPVALRRQSGDRPTGQQHLVVRVRVKRHNCRHRPRA
jgi:hypothetical protein